MQGLLGCLPSLQSDSDQETQNWNRENWKLYEYTWTMQSYNTCQSQIVFTVSSCLFANFSLRPLPSLFEISSLSEPRILPSHVTFSFFPKNSNTLCYLLILFVVCLARTYAPRWKGVLVCFVDICILFSPDR